MIIKQMNSTQPAYPNYGNIRKLLTASTLATLMLLPACQGKKRTTPEENTNNTTTTTDMKPDSEMKPNPLPVDNMKPGTDMKPNPKPQIPGGLGALPVAPKPSPAEKN
ncbi:hypothetical protein KKF84_19870 [Myxococcota bacterium]|nr:hypothetical protein [Myxococcota bacterium]